MNKIFFSNEEIGEVIGIDGVLMIPIVEDVSRLGNYSSYCQLVGHILGIESIAAWVSLDDKEVKNWHKVLALFVT